jgi:hypothetical protein
MPSGSFSAADRIEIISPHAELDRLEQLADLLDSRFVIPGTSFRFGLDAVIGLVPGVGDLLSMAISLYLVNRASRLGLTRFVQARMLANVAIDTAIGAIPFLGDIFDAGFKSNRRNIALARRALMRRGR